MVVGDVATGTELAVVGGGPGGYAAAIRAAQLDLDVTLIEADSLGGSCLNHGCIPSKALLSATQIAHRATTAEEMGIHADPDIEESQLFQFKTDVVDQLTGGVEKLCKANGVSLVSGTAQFEDDDHLRVAHDGDGQGSETIAFESAIVATGSQPVELPAFPFSDPAVYSSKQLLNSESLPEQIVIVGAGYIGMELATVLARLDCSVTILEALDSALPSYANDLSRPVRERAEAQGIEFRFGQQAVESESTDAGIEVVAETEAGDRDRHAGDAVLVAIGREPVTGSLNLEALGLEPDEAGFIPTDDRAETATETIFAVGDVSGEPMLAHKATHEGIVAAEVVAGEPAALDFRSVPAAVFTDPEIGTVGLSEAEAAEQGFDPLTGMVPLRASGRALTTGETDGFVRVVADGDQGFLLGAQIVSPHASELIGELSLAIELGATLEDVAATIHVHPTLSESVMEAAQNAMEQAIHTLNR